KAQNGRYVFKDDIAPGNYFYKRQIFPGKIVLYIDPLFAGIAEVMSVLDDSASGPAGLSVLPILPSGDANADDILVRNRREEALRWLAIARFYPDKLLPYLKRYARHAGSSYWFLDCDSIGVPLDTLIAQTRSESLRTQARGHAKQLNELRIFGPVDLLIDNRELAPVKNRSDLKTLLARVAAKNHP
ncbi:MAG: hypothetical protein PHC61_11665, partial [Chitinivibrionales bacterium]|nr:hypothetical protein [Chitinivibrionales bacterium]